MNNNNYIGADYTSQTRPSSFALLIHSIDFDWYNLHLYQVPKSVEKFTKTALAQCTVLAMAASLETVPPLYQINGKTVPPENHR